MHRASGRDPGPGRHLREPLPPKALGLDRSGAGPALARCGGTADIQMVLVEVRRVTPGAPHIYTPNRKVRFPAPGDHRPRSRSGAKATDGFWPKLNRLPADQMGRHRAPRLTTAEPAGSLGRPPNHASGNE